MSAKIAEELAAKAALENHQSPEDPEGTEGDDVDMVSDEIQAPAGDQNQTYAQAASS